MIVPRRIPLGSRGFTLVEVLVAVAILLMLSGAVLGFAMDLVTRRDRLGQAVRSSTQATAFFERLESDLFGAIAGDPRRGAGLRGDGSSLHVLTRSVGVGEPGPEARAALAGLRSCDFALDGGEVTYASGWTEGPAVERLVQGVALVRFRYFDGTAWRDSFDSSSAGALPAAIEAAIWFGPPGSVREGPAPEPSSDAIASDAGPIPEPRFGNFEDALPEEESTLPEPDRVRLILVPDGPPAAWRDRE